MKREFIERDDIMERGKCHDCGCKEGQFHQPGCDMERCPFCGRQLITCKCCYEKLGLVDFKKHNEVTLGLPKEVYENGLNDEQSEQWDQILRKKGLVPYIVYPVMCVRCGTLLPDFFNVPDEEWEKYIRIDERKSVLCRPCYDLIKKMIDGAAAEPETSM